MISLTWRVSLLPAPFFCLPCLLLAVVVRMTRGPLFKLRHPERSEANDLLFPETPRPSAVEGPRHFAIGLRSGIRALSARPVAPISANESAFVPSHVALVPPRSFDYGSAGRPGEKHLPLAFAQDDGVFGAMRSLDRAIPTRAVCESRSPKIPQRFHNPSRWLSRSGGDTTGIGFIMIPTPAGRRTRLGKLCAIPAGSILFHLVPKLHLGTHLSAKLCFIRATNERGGNP
jgi:hypothetical protein